MSKRKSQTLAAPTFYDFVRAAAQNRTLASEMIRSDHNWLSAKSSIGETALHFLVIENILDAVAWLIGNGAGVDIRDDFGNTPLMHAAQLGLREMVSLLIDSGADVNAVCDQLDNETALVFAAKYGYVEICETLISAGAVVEDAQSLVNSAPRRKQEAMSVAVLKCTPQRG